MSERIKGLAGELELGYRNAAAACLVAIEEVMDGAEARGYTLTPEEQATVDRLKAERDKYLDKAALEAGKGHGVAWPHK